MSKQISSLLVPVSPSRAVRMVLVFQLFLVFSVGTSHAMGGHSDEVYTWFGASPGYVLDDSTYFLVNYHLYRKPQGIYRFPDGGMSKKVHQGLYLMQYTDGRLFLKEKVSDRQFTDSTVKGTKGLVSDSELTLVMKPIGSDERRITVTITAHSVIAETTTAAAMATLEGSEPEKESITFTSDLVREHNLGALGLPSPLDYAEKRRNAYIRDLIDLKGDLPYRKEIIRTLELSHAEVEKILKAMEKKAQRLDGYKAMVYSSIAEETKAALVKPMNE
ncbi:MAG: hypothetical protein WCY01_11185 [Alkalispirochaeta sp.]